MLTSEVYCKSVNTLNTGHPVYATARVKMARLSSADRSIFSCDTTRNISFSRRFNRASSARRIEVNRARCPCYEPPSLGRSNAASRRGASRRANLLDNGFVYIYSWLDELSADCARARARSSVFSVFSLLRALFLSSRRRPFLGIHFQPRLPASSFCYFFYFFLSLLPSPKIRIPSRIFMLQLLIDRNSSNYFHD